MKIERLWQGNAVTIVGTVELDTLEAHIEALEKAKRGVGRALFYLRQIVGAVDGVMADWEHEKSAELVPTTIGQWAERAIIELAALRGEEGQ